MCINNIIVSREPNADNHLLTLLLITDYSGIVKFLTVRSVQYNYP